MKRLLEVRIQHKGSEHSFTEFLPDLKEVRFQLMKLGIIGRDRNQIKKLCKAGKLPFKYDLGDAMLYVDRLSWLKHIKMTVIIHVKSFYYRTRKAIWNKFSLLYHKLKRLFRRSQKS